MVRVINPEIIIQTELGKELVNPLRQEHRQPSGEEYHNGILNAAAILLINLTDIDNYTLECDYAKGSNLNVISNVARKLDNAFLAVESDFNYTTALIEKQKGLIEEAERNGIPIKSLI